MKENQPRVDMFCLRTLIMGTILWQNPTILVSFHHHNKIPEEINIITFYKFNSSSKGLCWFCL